MINHVELGGKQRPYMFTHRQQRHYEEIFNRPFAADLKKLMQQFAPVYDAISRKASLEEIADSSVNVSIVLVSDVMYSALYAGYYYEKKTIDFDVYDVADWIMGEPDSAHVMMRDLVSANTLNVNIDADKKKATTAKGRKKIN